MTSSLALEGIKARQQKTWASGDYGAVAAIIHSTAESLVQAADLSAGSRVVDVATGTGNAAIAAARCLCTVTGIDYVPELLDRARARAAAEHLPFDFVEGDAEALPYQDGEWDAVISVFGVMFTPNQEQAAAELTRVCRSGGTIALANWTPDGFIGELFRAIGRRIPPPSGVRAPSEWGSEPRIRELFGDRVRNLRINPREYIFRFPAPEDYADYFRAHYGPTLKAFEALDEDHGKLLYADLVELVKRFNVATDGTVKIRAAYVDVLATKV
jgi:ubiquinone/menaquinone biosynthesis C-methylase UbiE